MITGLQASVSAIFWTFWAMAPLPPLNGKDTTAIMNITHQAYSVIGASWDTIPMPKPIPRENIFTPSGRYRSLFCRGRAGYPRWKIKTAFQYWRFTIRHQDV